MYKTNVSVNTKTIINVNVIEKTQIQHLTKLSTGTVLVIGGRV